MFLEVAPRVVSSIMGLYPACVFVQRLMRKASRGSPRRQRSQRHARHRLPVRTRSSPRDSRQEDTAVRSIRCRGAAVVGLFALVPRLADHIDIPIVAAGGIGDGRGVAAASDARRQRGRVGTAFLRCPEAATHKAWADALDNLEPEDTMTTRALTGRLARGVATDYVRGSRITRGATSCPVPVQAWLDGRDEGGGSGGQRPPQDAVVGGTVGCDGKTNYGWCARQPDVGRGTAVPLSPEPEALSPESIVRLRRPLSRPSRQAAR